MRRERRILLGAIDLVLLGLVGVVAVAQVPATPTPERRRALELLAQADARSVLLEHIDQLSLGRELTVGEWLASDAGAKHAQRLWARTQPRHGPVRLYSDGVCEVDVRVSPATLRDQLLQLLAADAAAAERVGVSTARIRAGAARWPVVWATGSAKLDVLPRSGHPLGWENVSRVGIERARAAAEADACRALLERAGRLPVTDARRLAEFLDASGAVRSAVRDAVEQVAQVKVQFAPDQVAVASARLELRELLRIVTRVHERHYRGDEFAAADFRQMALRTPYEELEGTGLATPPSDTLLQQRPAALEFDVPDWVDKTITAIGRYEPHDVRPPDESVKLAAARYDGMVALHRKALRLVIQRDVTVAEFLAYHQDLKHDVTLFLSGARPVGVAQSLPDGGVEITVELPLRRLWQIVRRKMKLEEIEPRREEP